MAILMCCAAIVGWSIGCRSRRVGLDDGGRIAARNIGRGVWAIGTVTARSRLPGCRINITKTSHREQIRYHKSHINHFVVSNDTPSCLGIYPAIWGFCGMSDNAPNWFPQFTRSQEVKSYLFVHFYPHRWRQCSFATLEGYGLACSAIAPCRHDETRFTGS